MFVKLETKLLKLNTSENNKVFVLHTEIFIHFVNIDDTDSLAGVNNFYYVEVFLHIFH